MSDVIAAASASFVDHYTRRATFSFAHRLHESPLFDLDRLAELAARVPSAHYEYGAGDVGDGWRSEDGERPTLRETVETIATCDSLVLMKGLADDPEFGPLFREVVGELLDRVGPVLRDDVGEARATLIVSSPHRVTPYHFDGETNFLFQVRGTKMLAVFDPGDPTLLTGEELERFYAGDLSAARYQPQRQDDATTYTFAPGDAVHIPLHAPHWAQNGDDVSVAISVNVSLQSTKRLAQLYLFNHLMRKGGLTPAPPGTAPWRDRLKAAAAAGVDYARSRRQRRRTANAR